MTIGPLVSSAVPGVEPAELCARTSRKVTAMTRQRAGAVAAMMLLAFGVLGMHLTLSSPSTSHDQHVAHECHHDQECSPAPMSHLGAMCAAILAVVAVALVGFRRSGPPLVRRLVTPRRIRSGPTTAPAAPNLASLCILRC